jgi:hypothetical protein
MAFPTTQIAGGPFTGAYAITPSDVTQLTQTRALYVGGAGDIVVEMLNPQSVAATVTFKAVAAGTVLQICVERVLSTGTTATLILGLR